MLALPYQKGEVVDCTAPLLTFLNSQYGDEAVELFGQDISNFQQLRDAAVSSTDSSDASYEKLMRLNYHMSNLVPRLSGYESEFHYTFIWCDGFKTSKKFQGSSLHVDWACFLWNIAALESHNGARVDRSTDEGVKIANKHFQQAAGIFEYIGTKLMNFSGAFVVSGLTQDGIYMATHLMLAQAQLCFYEKAVRDKKNGAMKAGILAKLALQASVYFGYVSNSCHFSVLAATLDKSWAHHAEFQCKSFAGAAEYWQSQAAKEVAVEKGRGYGEEITRLTKAERLLNEAIELAKRNSLAPSLMNAVAGLLSTINATRVSAVNDNQTVYMESVPAESALVDIVPISMVKPSSTPLYHTTERPFFKELLPKAVRQLKGQYRDQVESIARRVAEEATAATSAARAALSAMGLPGSLEAYKSGGNLPDNLWNKIVRVKELGGLQDLQNKLDELEGSASRALVAMSTIDESLTREEKADSAFRARSSQMEGASVAGAMATAPSSVLNSDMRASNAQMRDAFSRARQNDQLLRGELSDTSFVEGVRILSASRDEIVKLFPKPAPALIDMSDFETTGSSVDTSLLEGSLVELAGLIEKRDQTVKTLAELAQEDITEQLVAAASAAGAGALPDDGPAAVVLRSVSRADSFVQQIASLSERQAALLVSITASNAAFNKARQADQVTLERDNLIKRIEQSISRYFNLQAQLTAGVTFYSNMQSRLSTLRQSCDDLSFTQQLLRQEYETNLVTNFGKAAQERRDREYAENLHSDMQKVSITTQPQQRDNFNYGVSILQPPTFNDSSSSSDPIGSGGYPSFDTAPRQQQLQQQQVPYGGSYAAPPYNISNNNSQPNFTGTGSSHGYPGIDGGNLKNVAYGLPISGPPAGAIVQHQFAATSPRALEDPSQSSINVSAPPYPQHHHPAAYSPPPTSSQPQPQLGAFSPQPPQYQQQQYQYNATGSGHASTPSAYYPQQLQQQYHHHQQQQQSPPMGGAADLPAKAARLAEMGFPFDACIAALTAHNGNEEAALNQLLNESATGGAGGGGNGNGGAQAQPIHPAGAGGQIFNSAPAAQLAAGASPSPAQAKKPSGLFGRVWGRPSSS